jgi:hypothetical protein
MRFRVTIRGEGIELRGYASMEALAALAAPDDQPYVIAASPAADDYDPFSTDEPREEEG